MEQQNCLHVSRANSPQPDPFQPNPPQPNQGVMDIKPYVAGDARIDGIEKIYKLSSNESPLGPPPSALPAYRQALENMAFYPDPQAVALRQAIARVHGLRFENIVCGNGSDELLGLIAHNYLSAGDEAVMTEHGFSIYEIQSRAAGAHIIKVPEKDCRIDIHAIIAAVSVKTKVVFIANPGNPTGTYLTRQEMIALHEALPRHVLLVIDGAYAEFVEAQDFEPGIELVEAHKNVVMTRTFSKIYGLAGLRIGWIYAPDRVIAVLDRVRAPFNVTLPAQMAAAASIAEQDFIAQAVAFNTKWRDWLKKELENLGLHVTPSVANFLLVHFAEGAHNALAADAHLRARGFILRPVASYGFPNALRLSIGCEEANRGVIAALADFMETSR